jgi:hypothetical protein
VASSYMGGARAGWRTVLFVSTVMLALAILVAGCTSSSSTTTAGGGLSTTSTTAGAGLSTTTTAGSTGTTANGTPTTASGSGGAVPNGATLIPDGAPMFATTLLDGPIVLGILRVDSGATPAAWFSAPDGSWKPEQIDSEIRWPVAAAQLRDDALLGDRLLVVGYDPRGDDQLSDPETSFAAVRKKGGGWNVVDLSSSVPAGTSLELLALGVTGDPLDMNTFFMAVGAIKSGAPTSRYLSEDITGATPVAMVSVNGTDWNPPVHLPLPGDVSEAEATSVVLCGPDTPAPGMIAVGYGYLGDDTLGTRMVGLVWRSTDNGTTWQVISDDAFTEPGRNISARFVATDGTYIGVIGQVDAPGSVTSGDNVEQSAAAWGMNADGTWFRRDDGPSDSGLRSSIATALAGEPGGGIILASEIYDTASGSTDPGADGVTGNPKTSIRGTSDGGSTWEVLAPYIPGIEDAVLIDGFYAKGTILGLVGVDKLGRGMSWAVDTTKFVNGQ